MQLWGHDGVIDHLNMAARDPDRLRQVFGDPFGNCDDVVRPGIKLLDQARHDQTVPFRSGLISTGKGIVFAYDHALG